MYSFGRNPQEDFSVMLICLETADNIYYRLFLQFSRKLHLIAVHVCALCWPLYLAEKTADNIDARLSASYTHDQHLLASLETAMVEQDLVALWEKKLVDHDHAHHTRRAYLHAVASFIAWYEQQNHECFTPSALTPIDLVGYRTMLQQSRSAASVNLHIASLRAFCQWLLSTGQINSNPAARLRAVARQATLAPLALAPKHINAMLRAAQQTRHPARDYAIIQMLIQTGIRIAECSNLRLADIRLGERQGEVQIRAGKGNKARTVPLNASIRQALALYLGPLWGVDTSIRSIVLAWPRGTALDQPLWQSQKRGALSVRAIATMIEHIVEELALRDLLPQAVSAHTLRHTFATNYLKDHPGDLVGLAALLGHSTLETTRIYVQPSNEDLAERVEHTRLNAYE